MTPVKASASILPTKRIKHTRVTQVMDELSTLIYPDSQESILLVCGPTGAGKTTLAKFMVENAHSQSHAEMELNAGVIPAIYVQAPASGETKFSWRLFYQRILNQLGDDLDSPKVAYGVDSLSGRLVRPRGTSGNSLARYGQQWSAACELGKYSSWSSTRPRTSFATHSAIASWRSSSIR